VAGVEGFLDKRMVSLLTLPKSELRWSTQPSTVITIAYSSIRLTTTEGAGSSSTPSTALTVASAAASAAVMSVSSRTRSSKSNRRSGVRVRLVILVL